MNLFLKIKAWQLFFLVMFPSLIIGILINLNVSTNITSIIGNAYFGYAIEIVLGWWWAIGTRLNKKVPEEIRMKSKFFRFGLIYSAIYFLFYSIYCMFIFGKISWIIIPSLFFAIFCMLYACYFISRNLFTVEKTQKVGFRKLANRFMLLWIFWIGIWYIQPKINKIFKEEIDI